MSSLKKDPWSKFLPAEEPIFNPLDKRILGERVTDELLARRAGPLPPPEEFHGAGIYAIYYLGNHPCYKQLAELNSGRSPRVPIYIGKAIPKGGRKGILNTATNTKSKDIYRRLLEHVESISATKLRLKDFRCRYLLVDDVWIPLAESMLIQRFRPVWNILLDGFGNHTPGNGRFKGKCPSWDVIHPGRAWAKKCKPHLKSRAEILRAVEKFQITK